MPASAPLEFDRSTVAQPAHANNVGAVRLVLALAVLVSHSYPLTMGRGTPDPLERVVPGIQIGGVAVAGFFVLSGFLITESWTRSRSTGAYLLRRVGRIYPGYLVAFLVSAAIGVVTSTDPWHYARGMYYANEQVVRNLLFLDGGALDGPLAFATNPFPFAVNGSLWTLQPELYCYALVAMAGLAGVVRPRPVLLIAGGCLAWWTYNLVVFPGQPAQLAYLFSCFACGAVIAQFPRLQHPRPLVIVGGVAAMLAGIPWPSLFVVLAVLCGSQMLFAIAFARVRPWSGWFEQVDISYGVYLYAFPVQQACVWALHPRSPVTLMVVAAPITVALAAASWLIIEAPAQRYAKRLSHNAR